MTTIYGISYKLPCCTHETKAHTATNYEYFANINSYEKVLREYDLYNLLIYFGYVNELVPNSY